MINNQPHNDGHSQVPVLCGRGRRRTGLCDFLDMVASRARWWWSQSGEDVGNHWSGPPPVLSRCHFVSGPSSSSSVWLARTCALCNLPSILARTNGGEQQGKQSKTLNFAFKRLLLLLLLCSWWVVWIRAWCRTHEYRIWICTDTACGTLRIIGSTKGQVKGSNEYNFVVVHTHTQFMGYFE